MKILYVRTVPFDFSPNTYNVQAYGLGKAFCNMGHDFDLLVFMRKERRTWVFYENNGCQCRCIERPRVRLFRMGINLSVANREFLDQYDLIITCEYNQIESYLIAKHSDRVLLYSGPYYNLFMLKFASPIFDYLFTKSMNKSLKRKFVKSDLAKQYLEQKGWTDVRTLGVGLDFERFEQPIEIDAQTQQVVEYMNSHRCILYVGALSDRKNYPLLLQIYQKVQEMYDDVRFVMIGKSRQSNLCRMMGKSDESYEAKFYNKLPDKVKAGIFRVERIDNSQLRFVYPLAKAFILPSKLEIFGMVLLESMYLGAPVISSRNGGSVTLIEGKGTGQIVEEFDAAKWATAVANYLDNPEYAESVTCKARVLITENYSWKVLAAKILNSL